MTPSQWNEYERQAQVIQRHEKWKAEQEKLNKIAEESWEGCDGCDENDKNFFINGFRTGYYRATPDEISDEEIEKAAKKCRFEDLDISIGSFELGAKWYREQLKKQ